MVRAFSSSTLETAANGPVCAEPEQPLVCQAPEEGPLSTPAAAPGQDVRPAVAKAPAPVGHDVGTMDPQELAKLKADPKTALMAQTIENASVAYADMIAGR